MTAEVTSAKEADQGRPRPQRILFVRLSALGDLVFASPLIASARQAYPEAHLAWLVQPEWAPVLAHHPALDEVIDWPLARWRRLLARGQLLALGREVLQAVRGLRARRFDWALDVQGLLKSALPVWLSGAPTRIGLATREGGAALMTQVVDRGSNHHQISSEYRHLADRLGWPTQRFQLALYPGSGACADADALLGAHRIGAGYIVLCPFTTRPQKHWLEPRWGLLARRLRRQTGLPCLILGGPNDRDAAARIAAQAEGAAVPLAGATSLLSAAALIHRAALLIGVDTGLSHMGVAFARPTLLLFGSTCPYTETGRANARVLYHARPCSPCRRRPTCDGAFSCMRDIEVAEVTVAAAQLLSAPPLAAPA